MRDQLEKKIHEVIAYLDDCKEFAPIIAVVAAVLLDKRAYNSPKMNPSIELIDYVHRITLSSDSVRSLLTTDKLFKRTLLDGKFRPSVFGLPQELKPADEDIHEYQVCISYAHEDRSVARKLAQHLRDESQFKVFFDDFEKHKLVGEDLIEMLYDVCARKSLFCVVLFSKAYLTKDWTRHELRAARARALRARGPYIFPVALERDAVPEELATTGYWQLRRGKEVEIANLISERVISWLTTNLVNEEEIGKWFDEMAMLDMVLSGFERGIEEAGEGPRADLLRLLGMVAAIGGSGSIVPSVAALLEYVVTSIPVVTKEFNNEKVAVKVFGDAYVHRLLGAGGPLLFNPDGWSDHWKARAEEWNERWKLDDEGPSEEEE
jgi:hypothetical protein